MANRPDHDMDGTNDRRLAETLARLAGTDVAAAQAAILMEQMWAHASADFLLDFPPANLAEVLQQILTFLGSRREEVTVTTLPMTADRPVLLLVNCGDAPYLVDSVQSWLHGAQIRFRLITHPQLTVRRKPVGAQLLTRSGRLPRGARREALLLFALDGVTAAGAAAVVDAVAEVVTAVLAIYRDRRRMTARMRQLAALLAVAEHRELWSWLLQGNFLPCASRCRPLSSTATASSAPLMDTPALGLPWPAAETSPALSATGAGASRLTVAESSWRSPVLRNEPFLYFVVREESAQGAVLHEFAGLLVASTPDLPPVAIPALRRRIEAALATLGIARDGHDHRSALKFFNNLSPLDLFLLPAADLVRVARSFALFHRLNKVKVVVVPHSLGGTTLLLLMPREFFVETLLPRFSRLLQRVFVGSKVGSLRPSRLSGEHLSLLVRVEAPQDCFSSRRLEGLEAGLSRLALPWTMRLRTLLQRHHGAVVGTVLWERYADLFPAAYRALLPPRFALRDIAGLEALQSSGLDGFDLWGPSRTAAGQYRLQHYSLTPHDLNELLPDLDNFALSVLQEIDFVVTVDGRSLYIKSFALSGGGTLAALSSRRHALLEALAAIRGGALESDNLNRLLLSTGLSWRQIDIFRGYRNYYFQLGSPFSRRRVDFALVNNPAVALLLYQYFVARFCPEASEEEPAAREERLLFPLRLQLAAALDVVADVNEDRILRTLFNLIDATVRTNYYRRMAGNDYFFAFKLSDLGIIDMPSPRPFCEIYVHAATMEGIHLRGGLVARGGIRWSDRPDDFRTEILGLMKTQMAKNVVIVPVGSKGGFVVKGAYTNREEGVRRAEAAYRTLMCGLLDLTDNRVGGRIVRPPEVIAYDGDDPYLVVAADKGTATFSDVANGIARDYGFWLDDAFASGGSHGYDHKTLAITARGAWECVKAHFRELGRDLERDAVSVVGIGDMSGDVFGNGMLLSSQLRLQAAFDHRHIFLDPEPEPLSAHAERQRLFCLPRSSWDDYDRTLLSAGGGIYPRDAKEIVLSPEVKAWLGCHHDSIDPAGLIRLLLCAPVDLLWNGGIGTYVKAAAEKHEEVGDRANDGVRVDGGRLRALVVGEGGNLGFTQRGRIEYALAGGRINTDAVDNSGGVDCSDHEVNLKIFMQHLSEVGVISSRAERDRLLAAVSDEVCAAVLADNRAQSLALSLDQRRCATDLAPSLALAARLEDAGLLDRKGECFPSEAEVRARPQPVLTRPELAILMAYAKMQLYQGLLDSDLSRHPGTQHFLLDYLPLSWRKRFGARMVEHPLARELVATVMTNRIVNQGGSTLVHALVCQSAATPDAIVTAYLALDRILVGDSLRQALCPRDGGLPVEHTYALLLGLEKIIATLIVRGLVNGGAFSLAETGLTQLRQRSDALLSELATTLSPSRYGRCRAEAAALEKGGLPTAAAWRLAAMREAGEELVAGLLATMSVQEGTNLHEL